MASTNIKIWKVRFVNWDIGDLAQNHQFQFPDGFPFNGSISERRRIAAIRWALTMESALSDDVE
jgi:hypothetical protein